MHRQKKNEANMVGYVLENDARWKWEKIREKVSVENLFL